MYLSLLKYFGFGQKDEGHFKIVSSVSESTTWILIRFPWYVQIWTLHVNVIQFAQNLKQNFLKQVIKKKLKETQ